MENTMEKRIPVIIPAYEPDEKMIRLLQTLQESGIERIVVVDDGSGKEYRNLFEQAKQLGAIVLTHAVNLGKGRALKTAFNEVLNRYPEAIGAITADSDGQHTPACIQKCMEAMEAGKADFRLPEFRSGQRPGKIGMGQQNHTSGAQIPLRRGGIGYPDRAARHSGCVYAPSDERQGRAVRV